MTPDLDPPPRLLYIEDDPDNARLIEQVFARLSGFEVLSATHGRAGIERAQREQPDVILLDLHLPDMSGDEVTVALKADPVTRAIPIVALSGGTDPVRRARVLELGASAFVAKPYQIRELIAVVERYARAPRAN